MSRMVIVGVRFPQHIIDKLDRVAEKWHVTRSDVIRRIVYENIGAEGVGPEVKQAQEVKEVKEDVRHLFGLNYHGRRPIR